MRDKSVPFVPHLAVQPKSTSDGFWESEAKRILKAELARQGYEGWAVVEQDVLVEDLEAPRRFSQQNREYLQSIGLVKE